MIVQVNLLRCVQYCVKPANYFCFIESIFYFFGQIDNKVLEVFTIKVEMDFIFHRFYFFRRDPNWTLPATVPPGTTAHREGRRRQQLRPRTLHRRQGTPWPRPRQDPKTYRELHRTPRVPAIPLLRRRNRVRIHFASHGATLGGLWKKVETWVRCLSSASSRDSSRGTIQLHLDDAHDSWALRLRLHGWQRGHLWYMQAQSGNRTPVVYQLEPTHISSGLLNHRFVAVRRCLERRLDWVPDELGTLPEDPLPSGDVRAYYFSREGVPRATECAGDY